MKITAVKDWDVLDEDRSFAIGPCHASDIGEAVAVEHYDYDSSCCDVCRAREAGFPVVAADLFSSGMESLLFAAIDQAHRFNRSALPAGHLESEWRGWLRYYGEAEAKDGSGGVSSARSTTGTTASAAPAGPGDRSGS